MEWFEPISQIIASLGFPICVAGYFIFKVQKTQEEITKTLTELALLVNKIYEEVIHNERS